MYVYQQDSYIQYAIKKPQSYVYRGLKQQSNALNAPYIKCTKKIGISLTCRLNAVYPRHNISKSTTSPELVAYHTCSDTLDVHFFPSLFSKYCTDAVKIFFMKMITDNQVCCK